MMSDVVRSLRRVVEIQCEFLIQQLRGLQVAVGRVGVVHAVE
jgi:hypothetical protein